MLEGEGIPAVEILPNDEALLGGEDAPEDVNAVSEQIDDVVGLIRASQHDPAQLSVFLNQQRPGTGASPIHAVAPALHWLFKPGTDPVPRSVVLDNPGDSDETRPYVAVIDSGLVHEAAEWAETPHVRYDEFDIEVNPGAASHGTFITGLIRQISPLNRVSMARVPFRDGGDFATSNETPPAGVALSDEMFVFEAVVRLINRHVADGTDVAALNMSLGTYTCDPEGEDLLVVLAAALEMWSQAFPESELFAAGGNEEHDQPFWPGALATVRAVAAANLASEQVVWANQVEKAYPGRPWIDDVAPGSNLVSLSGVNNQLVSWSGSSFATAVAAALFARPEEPTADRSLDWWLDYPLDYDNIPGLTYTQTADPLEPVIHVDETGTPATVTTSP